jgi:hypothetical protein
MKSVMDSSFNFARVPQANIPRSVFNRSFGRKQTMDASYLTPIMVDLAYPGDTFMCNLNAFGRLSTPIYPIMDNIYLEVFFFKTAIRQIWDNFKKFMGEQVDPGDSIAYTLPTVDINGEGVGTLTDYLGLPITTSSSCPVVSLWHRSYNKIFSEWFRSQDLTDTVDWDTDDGPDTIADYQLLKASKKHDYFTACLPYPQKGSTATDLPLGTTADVAHDAADAGILSVYSSVNSRYDVMDTNATNLDAGGSVGVTGNKLYADLSSATAATINELREAYQIQRLLERDSRSGTRYHEVVRSHFGIINPESIIADRSIYLGGGKVPINMSTVPRTNDFTTTQGADLSAFGTMSINGSIGFKHSFTEHCTVMGLALVRGDVTYQQGIPRMFNYSTRYDMYWPVFAHLGEQAVLNQEIFWTGTPATDAATFGYIGRYDEMRYKNSEVCGNFRSDAATNYDEWHLSEDFASVPTLNDSFIRDNTVTVLDRAIATPAEPQIILDMYFDYKCVRPMPTYGVPGFIDHF